LTYELMLLTNFLNDACSQAVSGLVTMYTDPSVDLSCYMNAY